MLLDETKTKVREFLHDYPNARIQCITTLRSGYASCIKPVPQLFGPEVHCLEEDYSEICNMRGK